MELFLGDAVYFVTKALQNRDNMSLPTLLIKYSVYAVLAAFWLTMQCVYPNSIPFWAIFVAFFLLDVLFDCKFRSGSKLGGRDA
jgi:asparagine N-glycosylation enzyme membrane subunit Stt3